VTVGPEDNKELEDYYDRMNNFDFGAPKDTGLITGYNKSLQGKQPKGLIYQNTQAQDPRLADQIANKIMAPVAKGIEAAQKNSLLSWIVNPALNVSQWIGQHLIDPAARVLSTPFLVSDALEKGKGLDYAWEQAQYISPGQALANATFLPADDIFDEEKRKELYEDSWIGLLTTGTIDLGVNILGSKGTGAVTRGGRNLVLGSNQVKDFSKLRPLIEDAVRWGEGGAASASPNSWAGFIDEAVKATDVNDLRSNVFVQNSSNPDRLATLLANTNSHRGVAEILMAERGDVMALNRLRDELPLAHDALTDFGFDMTKPLVDWADIHKLPEGDEIQQYYKIIDGIAKKDKNFARALDSFVDDVSNQKYLTTWKPGRFAALEKARMYPEKFRMAALYGDWGYLKSSNENGWVVKTIQGDRYTRGIRIFQKMYGAKARGHINVSNPRMGESVQEILSELNKINFLRDNLEFKQNAVKLFTTAQDDTGRALAIGQIEQNVLVEMAKHYNLDNMRDIAQAGGSIDDQIARLKQLHEVTSRRRDSAMKFVNEHGFVIDTDGNINFMNGVKYAGDRSIVLTSTEAQNVPMMDLARLEANLVLDLKRLESTPMGAVGKFNLTRKDVVSAELRAGTIGQIGMTVGHFGDRMHMLFSNLHLLRPAFIPKNSFLDNFMRSSMMLERPMGVMDGTSRLITENLYKNTQRRLTKILPTTIKGRFGKESRDLDSALDNVKYDMGAVEKTIGKTNKSLEKSRKKLEYLNAELKQVKGKNANAVAQRQSIQDKIRDESERLKNLEIDFESSRNALDNFAEARKAIMSRKAAIISNLQDEKAALNYLGKEKFVYKTRDGEVIEVKGVWDPNTKGASAFRSEADSYGSWYQQQLTADAALRLRQQNNWVELQFNPANLEGNPDFFEAVSHHMNMHIRTDDLGRRMLQGQTDDELFDWLRRSSDGREYARRIKDRIDSSNGGVLIDDDSLRGYVSYVRNNINERFPSQELRDIALNRPVTAKEVSAWLSPYGDTLPSIFGPDNKSAFKSMTFGEKALGVVEAVPDTGWKLISWFENKVARMPLYRTYWKEEATSYAKYLEANGFKVTDELLNGAIRQTAHRKALARVEDTLYSSRRLTNGMYASRYLMSFPAAYFNSQKVALKLLARNPYNAYWYNSVANAMDSGGIFGAYYQDTETGEIYEKLKDVPEGVNVTVRFNVADMPGGKYIEEKLRDFGLDAYLDSALGGPGIPQKQLEFMLQDPSLAFTATAALSEVVKMADGDSAIFGNVTGQQIIEGLKNAFGDDFYNNSIFFQGRISEGDNLLQTLVNSTVPTTYKQLGLFFYGDESDQMLVDEANRLYRVQYREWYNNGSNPADKPVYEDTVKAAKNALVMRALISFNAPLSISFDPASREAMMRYSQLMDKYANAGGKQYELATDEFVSLYGVGSLALLGSSNYRMLGQAATASNQEILYNHRDLIQEISSNTGNAESAEIIFWSPDGDSGDYQSELAAMQERMTVPGTGGQNIVRPKTAQEVREDIEKRIGWYEYSKLDQLRQSEMEAYGITSTGSTRYAQRGIRARFMLAERALREKYPAWDRSRQFNTQNWYTVVGDAINTALANEKWMQAQGKKNSLLWSEIGQFMRMSNDYRSLYEGARYNPEMAYRREVFEKNYWMMLQNFSTQFGAFASRWLSNHPLLNPDLTEGVLSNG
jgi:hypothetical protein